MNGQLKNKKKTRPERKEIKNKVSDSVQKLINTYNCCNLNQSESIDVVSNFLYSIGCAISKKENLTSEEILHEYAINPTYGVH